MLFVVDYANALYDFSLSFVVPPARLWLGGLSMRRLTFVHEYAPLLALATLFEARRAGVFGWKNAASRDATHSMDASDV